MCIGKRILKKYFDESWKIILTKEIEHSSNSASDFLSISIGLYVDKVKLLSKAEIFLNTDIALYEAKNNGRNQVKVYFNN